MYKLILIAISCVLTSSLTANAGMIFKCRGSDGKLLYQETPCKGASNQVSSWGSEGSGSIKISQGFNGHYFLDGSINERPINFIIDTGASSVAIPQGYAIAAGLKCIKQIQINTGNGSSMACTTQISILKFGSFTFRNIDAVIAPGLEQPLLGMNILKEFHIEQDGGEMLLSKR